MAFDRRETLILLIGDFVVLALSLWVALTIRNLEIPSVRYFETNIIPFLPVFFLSLAVFYIAGLYEKQTRPIRRVMGARILGAQAANVAMAAILFFVLPLNIAPKTILVLYLIASVLAEISWRFYRMRYELATEKRTPAILVGSGGAVDELYEEVRANGRYLMYFVDRIETTNCREGEVAARVNEALTHGVRAVVIDVSDARVARDLTTLYDRLHEGAAFIEFAALYEEIFDRVPLEHLDLGQMLESLPRARTIYDATKRVFDIVLAALGMFIAAPFVTAAAAVLVAQGGSPLISQRRVGKGGRVFYLQKLRSMLFDDNGDAALHAKNRVTRFGRFLRRTRIDELPQLWNVLKGELSFIGPRPEIPEIVAVYEREIAQYPMRHLIVPGLSGWAQIHHYDAPHGPADVERTRRKLSLDLYYLKHRSFGLDLAIAMKSLRALLSFSGS
jgi:lipopolysaccharide/colanic/teichoic acid biosynthesis glycosyltransferase